MLKSIFFFTFIVILASPTIGAVRKAEPDSEVLVLLAAKGEISSEGQQVMRAIKEYVDYYLYTGSYNFEIEFPRLERESLETYLKTLDLHSKRAVIYLRIDGQVTRKIRPVRNYRRSTQLTTVNGFLTITIDYQIILFDRGRVESDIRGQVVREPRRSWLAPIRGINSRLIDSLVTVTPEPYEYIIEDALSEALEELPHLPAPRSNLKTDLPAIILVDSTLIGQLPEWRHQAKAIFDVAARSIRRSFDYGLDLVDIRPAALQVEKMNSLHELFNARREQFDDFGDTLLISLVGFASPLQQFSINDYEAVGLSQVGKRRILLHLLSPRRDADPRWEPYLNGLNLVHEIGHAFGAIHVSDLNSVMNHSSSWQGTAQFDPFNRQILQMAFSGQLVFGDPAVYLYHVSRLLEKNSYPLVDYPSFYFDFLGGERDQTEFKKLAGAVGNSAFIDAAKAYQLWAIRDYEHASTIFEQLTKKNPEQAALWYYLGLNDGSENGYEAMQRSAELGYWKAKFLLQLLTD